MLWCHCSEDRIDTGFFLTVVLNSTSYERAINLQKRLTDEDRKVRELLLFTDVFYIISDRFPKQ